MPLTLEHDIHTFRSMPKEIIRFLQSLCVVGCADKELAAIGIGACVGHGNTAGGVICQYRLIFEFVARTTLTCTLRVTCLNNELGYNAMEFEPVIKMLLRQEDKVIDCIWCQLRIEFQHDQTTIGIDSHAIDLLGIYRHRRRLTVCMCNLIEVCPTRTGRTIRQFSYNR